MAELLHHAIDSEGDVFLNLSADPDALQRLIRVSSKVLCLASPVFKAMLGSSSPFKEAVALRNGPPAVIPLIGDNEEALLVVLNAAHLRTQLIPGKVTFDLFYQLAVVCDKYDMAQVLLPWPILWASDLTTHHNKPGYERWLVISWVFRQCVIFERATQFLIVHTGLDKDNNLVLFGNRIESGIVPDSVIDAIRVKRLTLISSIFSLCKAKIDSYSTAASQGLNVCKDRIEKHKVKISTQHATQQRNKCDNIQAGSLLRCLATLGFYPIQREMDSRSAKEIHHALETIEYMEEDGIDSHKRCDVLGDVESAVEDLLENHSGLFLSHFMPTASLFLPLYDAGLSYPLLRENDPANSRAAISI